MLRASSCPSPGAYKLRQPPLFYRWNVVLAVLLVVVGPDRPRPMTLLPPRSNDKPEAATAVYKLLMMGMRMPETCWAVFKQWATYLKDWCIWLVDLFECSECCIPSFGWFPSVWIYAPMFRNTLSVPSSWVVRAAYTAYANATDIVPKRRSINSDTGESPKRRNTSSWNLHFLHRFSKHTQILNFIKFRPVRTELLLVDRRTDRCANGQTQQG